MDIKTKTVMYDKLNMIYVEIPKLKKKKEELTTHLDKKGFKRGVKQKKKLKVKKR